MQTFEFPLHVRIPAFMFVFLIPLPRQDKFGSIVNTPILRPLIWFKNTTEGRAGKISTRFVGTAAMGGPGGVTTSTSVFKSRLLESLPLLFKRRPS